MAPRIEPPILGLILAAGTSSRLGRPKQLEPIRGRPLIAHTVEQAQQGALDAVLVVVGNQAEEVTEAMVGFDVDTVFNQDFATGQASSLVVGVREAELRGADAVVVMLADQPGVEPGAIQRLVTARRVHRAKLAMARYGTDRGHPVLFGRELFAELLELTGDTGGRDIIRRHQADLVLVDGGRDTIPVDLDEESDLVRLHDDFSSDDFR